MCRTISKNNKKLVRMEFSHRCCKCGSTKDLTIDHIIPVAMGGTSTRDNLQLMCQSCNLAKASRVEVYKYTHDTLDYISNWILSILILNRAYSS